MGSSESFGEVGTIGGSIVVHKLLCRKSNPDSLEGDEAWDVVFPFKADEGIHDLGEGASTNGLIST